MAEFKWNDGKIDYDFENDSLLIYSPSHRGEYAKSYSIEDFIIDVDDQNQVISYEFLNAAELFGVPKSALNKGIHVKGKFNIERQKKRINIEIQLVVKYRNKQLQSNYVRDLVRDDLKNIKSSKASISAS
ncbi:hypothetical protein COT72_01510 [archaeon CG10_big_fil_rev_8_21_14_0_10_43_11]|nr:MAG: hypothetical protein COT72_01510 [archaeon CG10_big_fil_rev_8_21_14_0_10_43_11]